MDLLEKIKQAGVIGAGGAGFPTHIKLDASAEYFIVNALECEPLIAVDKYCCREQSEQIVAGTMLAASAVNAQHIVIALKKTYRREIESLQAAIDAAGAPIELFKMAPFYPAGDEQIVVQAVTGKSIPERGLPSAVGAAVDNVGTVCGIAQAAAGAPVTQKTLSVIGAVPKPLILTVPIGTPVTDCLALAGGMPKGAAVILGGPMMGRMIWQEDVLAEEVVSKTLGNLLVLPKDHFLTAHRQLSVRRMKRQAMAACIQCRMCTDLCPRQLIGHRVTPHRVMRNAFKEATLTADADYLSAYGSAVNCCGCGVCEMFACPMGLSPKRINDYFKGQLRERKLAPEFSQTPKASPMIDFRRVPTNRLIARLGLSEYQGQNLEVADHEPNEVRIPLNTHIGAPAKPVVILGEEVARGTLIGEATGAVSANVHSSIDGIVTAIDECRITITKEKEMRRKGEDR